MNDYPMLHFIGRHGGWCAIVLGLVPLLAGLWLFWTGASAWWIAAGLGAAIVIFGVMRSYVELVRVMIDMLLPK